MEALEVELVPLWGLFPTDSAIVVFLPGPEELSGGSSRKKRLSGRLELNDGPREARTANPTHLALSRVVGELAADEDVPG